MKTCTIKLRSLIVFSALLFAAVATHAEETLSAERLSAFYVWNYQNNPDGTGAYDVDNWLGAGQFSGGGGQLQRALLTFTLPEMPQGQEVKSAVLGFMLHSSSTSRVGDLSLYHSITAAPAAPNASFYQNPSYTLIDSSVATPSTAAWTWVYIDVTDYVKADYAYDAAGSLTSSFRFQVDLNYGTLPGGYGDTDTHRYAISRNLAHSSLIIETQPAIPESSTYALLAGLGVGGVVVAARCRKHRAGNA